jgi:deaminated glutathione amidase
VRVAIAQFAATRDKDANRDRVVELVRRAGDAAADLVVLPEAAMHPFGGPTDPLADVAEPVDGPFATAVAEAAARAGLVAVAGMFESVPGEDRVWNTVVVAGPDGPLGAYRKLHLFDALGWRESDRIRPADLDPADEKAALLTIPVGELTVGVLTCYDLRFPELSRALVDAGATLLALPSAWVAGPLKEAHWLTLVTARAIENTCYVAAADQGPPVYAGQSVVVDPMGVPVARIGESDGLLAVAEVSAARVEQVRETLPVLAHRRYEVVARRGATG